MPSFLNNINLNKNELQNARVQNLGSAPGSPVQGQIYWDTGASRLYGYTGAAWQNKATDSDLLQGNNTAYHLARANHTGTQAAATISDFDTQVRTSRLDQMTAPSGSVSMNSQKITNLLTPTADTDAATKAYADAAAAGIDAKASVRAATTANITLSGAQTIDGVSIVADERVLVKNQSSAPENGPYLCKSGAWVRTTDCDSTAEYTSQAFVFVEEGTTNGGTQWKVSTTGAITVGTTAVTWAQFGAGSAYTAGNGLQLSGSAFSVKLPGSSGLVADGTGTYLDTAIAVRKYAVDVGDGSSTSITVTHNLGTKDVTVGLFKIASTYDEVVCDIQHTTTNTITLIFAVAPTSAQYRCVVHG